MRKYYKYVSWTQPVLTGYTTSSDLGNITVSATSDYGNNCQAWKIMIGSTSSTVDSNYWQLANSSREEKLTLVFPYKLKISDLKITTRPKDNYTRNVSVFNSGGLQIGSTINCSAPLTEYTILSNGNIITNTLIITVASGSDVYFGLQNLKITAQRITEGTSTDYDYYEDIDAYKAYKETVRHYYKYIPFVQPVLTANGTMGGDTFACNQSSYHTEKDGTKREAWQAFDNNTGTRWQVNGISLSTFYDIEWYCPIPIITSSLSMQTSTNYPVKDYVLYGSNNYRDWIELASGTNAGSSVDWTITIVADKQKEYSYFRLSCKPTNTTSMMVNSIGINAVYITEGTSSDYDFYKDINEYKVIKDTIRTYYKRASFTSDSTFTVPSGITKLKIDCVGAKGYTAVSGSYIGNGGNGGRVECDLAVSAGQVLNITVGAVPTTTSQSYNASDIRIGGNTLDDRVIVAGGGGSGVYKQDPRGVTKGVADGGAGGGLVGGAGGDAGSNRVGQGGTQSDGGLGAYSSYPYHPFTAGNGEFGLGGTGTSGAGGIAGAGGAGWYGGGGAGCNGIFISAGYSSNGAAGGGGSSYTNSSCTNVVHTQGYQNGTGYITIDYESTSSDYDYYIDNNTYKALKV